MSYHHRQWQGWQVCSPCLSSLQLHSQQLHSPMLPAQHLFCIRTGRHGEGGAQPRVCLPVQPGLPRARVLPLATVLAFARCLPSRPSSDIRLLPPYLGSDHVLTPKPCEHPMHGCESAQEAHINLLFKRLRQGTRCARGGRTRSCCWRAGRSGSRRRCRRRRWRSRRPRSGAATQRCELK